LGHKGGETGVELIGDVNYILDRLNQRGYEAYAVGGCVRDAVMGRTPADWDIATSATPPQVKASFRRTVDTGIKHGTVTVLLGKRRYEITTYRLDGPYSDGRRPDAVTYTTSLTADLERRDFTMNAIAYHSAQGFVDPFGGAEDIRRKLIRCVGRPTARFGEDALRMLRALRFKAQLGFEIEAETYGAIGANGALMANISAERIREELTKLLATPRPAQVAGLGETGLAAHIDPILGAYLEALPDKIQTGLERGLALGLRERLALLFSQMPDRDLAALLKRLRFDTATLRAVCLRVRAVSGADPFLRGCIRHPSPQDVRQALSQLAPEELEACLGVYEALEGDKPGAEAVRICARAILNRGDCCRLGQLALNGDDLCALGVPPGQETGRMLQKLLDAVLAAPERNTPQALTALAVRLLGDTNLTV
jgi:tRNA nucleotidyltransferase (CCA-adding enzyme)